jgi:lantibiotic modifying enzyme
VVENEVYNFNNAYNVWIHFKRYDELAVKKQIEFAVSRFISYSIEILSKTSTTDGEDFEKITTEFKKPFDKACLVEKYRPRQAGQKLGTVHDEVDI